jgi:hypothetical protein
VTGVPTAISYMTLETIAPLGHDPLVALPPLAA